MRKAKLPIALVLLALVAGGVALFKYFAFLPLYTRMTDADVQRVCDTVRGLLRG